MFHYFDMDVKKYFEESMIVFHPNLQNEVSHNNGSYKRNHTPRVEFYN